MYKRLTIFCTLLMAVFVTNAQTKKIIVDATGKSGAFRTIQGAINSLPDSAAEPRVIFIRKGVYREKLYLQKHNIVLEGEDKNAVIITQAIARDEWRCLHNDDWGVATINIEANDITLKDLTITNSYGFDWTQPVTIACLKDSVNPQKQLRKDGHQMALRTFQCTRMKVINCILRAFGGDTVSPWNVQEGLWYFKDCVMEGGVDFYCPRGWAYAENCEFIAHTGPASIWHDGSVNRDSKTVLKNCSFKGYDGFKLGRYHRDAQFYLINCSFAENMADTDIYLVPTTNTIQWGRRIYYFNCHRPGRDFTWYADNLATAPGAPAASAINAVWTFAGKWKP
ncbi:MAG: pectinesterase family protein [Chitinophagaceae bacterium]